MSSSIEMSKTQTENTKIQTDKQTENTMIQTEKQTEKTKRKTILTEKTD